MSDCLFCKIVGGEIPATVVHQTDRVLAFADINPQAPTHVLIIPKRHIAKPVEIAPDDEGVVGELFTVAAAVAKARGVADSGYRLVMNNGAEAGQSVFHIHLHLLGGRALTWPPG